MGANHGGPRAGGIAVSDPRRARGRARRSSQVRSRISRVDREARGGRSGGRGRAERPAVAHPPLAQLSHHRCSGEKKRRGGGGTAGRAPTTRRAGIRAGRLVRVLVGEPEAFNVVPIPPRASAPRGAPLISPATHAPVTPRRGRKKKHSLDPTNPVARAPAGGGGDATSLDAPRRARTES